MQSMKTYSKKSINEKADPVVASTYGLPPPTNNDTASRLAQIDDMKYFFVSATQQWEHNRPLKRFALPGGESISCIFWDDLFFITGTDIVRSLTFRFHAFGRPVTNAKKFEEGIFSDLRNLKPGHDARLEEPKSELLDMLYKNNCIRTQKKQKVFFWFSVPHDRLFLDALERDLKREKMGMEPTTKAVAEPAASLSLDSTQELFDQLRKNISQPTPIPITSLSLNAATQVTGHSFLEEENWTQWQSAIQQKRPRVNSVPSSIGQKQQLQLLQQQQKQNRLSHGSYFSGSTSTYRSTRPNRLSNPMLTDDFLTDISKSSPLTKYDYMDPIANGVHQLEISSSTNSIIPSKSLDLKKQKTIFGNLSLFDGSPTYKLRRRRASSTSLRRHDNKCRAPVVSNSSSRLAMAAVKAGFTMPQSFTPTVQDYHCPVPECRHLFKRMEHLERHMQALHNFTCTVCGKQFAKSEKLVQHHRLEHQIYDTTTPLNYGDFDDDSSHDGQQHQPQQQQFLQHYQVFQSNNSSGSSSDVSPRHSFDGSRSSGWSAGIPGSVSSSSRCSTLSPMLDEENQVMYSPEPMTTLLSPFKFQPQQQQQHEDVFDFNMDINTIMNDYAPFVDQQYPPFSPDIFGA